MATHSRGIHGQTPHFLVLWLFLEKPPSIVLTLCCSMLYFLGYFILIRVTMKTNARTAAEKECRRPIWPTNSVVSRQTVNAIEPEV